MTEPTLKYLKVRVVKVFDKGNVEVCADLPHLHRTHVEVVAFQPGNPGSSTLGSFTLPLHPPGSEGYKAAKVYYDQLDRYQRVEFYDGGKLYYAGIVTKINRQFGTNAVFELQGQADTALANKAVPFPGEFLSNDVTSAIFKSYLGTNEAGPTDTFNPFTAGNYVSTNIPGLTAGTWTGTTDDGLSVVTNSTGTGAVLLSKTGAAANDRWHTHYMEYTGRVNPSADSSRAAEWGMGISNSNANVNDCVWAFAVARKLNGRFLLDVGVNTIVAGVVGTTVPTFSVLQNVDDPQGMIPFTIGMLWTLGGNSTATQNISVTINGRVVTSQIPAGVDPGTVTRYPFLYNRTPNSGSANYYCTNLVHKVRFTPDGPSTASVYTPGSISTSTHSLGYGVDPGPTFLEAWSRLATREGWYWRYTPTPYVVGTRTLGTMDLAPDPGTDRGTNQSVVFSRANGTLVDAQFTENADNLASHTVITSQPTADSGGLISWHDIASISKYGMIEDEAFSFTHSDFNSARHATQNIVSNKVNVNVAANPAGSKTVTVLRDPQTADVWRELDKVMIDDPEMGMNKQVCRVLGYTFDEGQATQTLTLDQFSENDF